MRSPTSDTAPGVAAGRGILLTVVGAMMVMLFAQPGDAGLAVTAEAAHRGNAGLAVELEPTPLYVEDDNVTQELWYRARFYVNPDGLSLANGVGFDLFDCSSAGSNPEVRLRLSGSNGAVVLSSWARSGNGLVAGPQVQLVEGWQAVEIEWKAATTKVAENGYLSLFHQGQRVDDLPGLDNFGETIDTARLGAVGEIDAGAAGTFFADDFVSVRGRADRSWQAIVNRDGVVNSDDLFALHGMAFAPELPQSSMPSVDINSDMALNAADLSEQIKLLFEGE